MRQHTAVIALFLFGGVFVLGLLALASMLGPGVSQADDATMHNCPQASRWAVAVWGGDDGTSADQAFATCGEGAVVAAYSIDPQTQAWSRWFADQPGLSTLSTLDKWQGVIALGGAEVPASPTPTPSPSPTPTPTPCPTTTPCPDCGELAEECVVDYGQCIDDYGECVDDYGECVDDYEACVDATDCFIDCQYELLNCAWSAPDPISALQCLLIWDCSDCFES